MANFFTNPKQFINLLTTAEDCRNIFPRDQAVYVWDFVGLNDADWSLTLEWVTVVVDKVRFSKTNEPNFAGSLVIGYFEGGSVNYGSTQTIVVPENMYTGPILPASDVNIPITIVNMQWVKNNGETVNRQILFIQNWEPGVKPGDPTLDDNFIIIEVPGVEINTATVILEVLEPITIYEQSFRAKLICDVPSTLASTAKAKFYAKTSTTSYKLIYEGTWTTVVEGVNVSEVSIPTYWGDGDPRNLSANDYTIRGEWPGRRNWPKRFSNLGNLKVIDGIPLNVTVDPAPITSTQIGETISLTATATTASGYAVFTTTNIANTVTFTIEGTSTYAALTATRVISTTTFVGNDSIATATAILNITNDLVESIPNANSTFTLITGTVVDNLFTGTALVSRTFPVNIRWDAYKPSLIGSGSTSTTLTVTTTRNFSIVLQPLIVEANERFGLGNYTTSTDFRTVRPELTNNIYTYPPYNLVSDPLRRGPVIRATIKNTTATLVASTVTFRAFYTSTVISDFAVAVQPSNVVAQSLIRATGIPNEVKDFSQSNATIQNFAVTTNSFINHFGIPSMSFDYNQYSVIQTNKTITWNTDWTIELWAFWYGINLSWDPRNIIVSDKFLNIASNIKISSTGTDFNIPGVISGFYGWSGGQVTTILPHSTWHHIAIIYDKAKRTISLFVGGYKRRTINVNDNPSAQSNILIGNTVEPAQYGSLALLPQIGEIRYTPKIIYLGDNINPPVTLMSANNIVVQEYQSTPNQWLGYQDYTADLVSAPTNSSFTFESLPPLIQPGDQFTIGGIKFTVASANIATNTVQTSVWTGLLNPTSYFQTGVTFRSRIQNETISTAKWLGYNATTSGNWIIFGNNQQWVWKPGSGQSVNWNTPGIPVPCETGQGAVFGTNSVPFVGPLYTPGVGFNIFINVISVNYGLQGYAQITFPDNPQFYYRFNALPPNLNFPVGEASYLGQNCPYFIWSSSGDATKNKGIRHYIRAINYSQNTVVATRGGTNGAFIQESKLSWAGQYWDTPAGPRGKYNYFGYVYSDPFNEPENIGEWAEFYDGQGRAIGTFTAELVLGKSVSPNWTTSTAYPNELYQTLDVTMDNDLVSLLPGNYQIYASYDYNDLSQLVRTPVGPSTTPLQLKVRDPVEPFFSPSISESGNNLVFSVKLYRPILDNIEFLKDTKIDVFENNVFKGSRPFNNYQTEYAEALFSIPKNQFTTATNIVGSFDGTLDNYRYSSNYPLYSANTFTFVIPSPIYLKSNIVLTNTDLKYNSNNTLEALVSGTYLGPATTPQGWVKFEGSVNNVNGVINQTATIVNGVSQVVMNTTNLSSGQVWSTATITATYISTNNFPSTSTTKNVLIDPPNALSWSDNPTQVPAGKREIALGSAGYFNLTTKNYYPGEFTVSGYIDVKCKPGSFDPNKINLISCNLYPYGAAGVRATPYMLPNYPTRDKALFVVSETRNVSAPVLIDSNFIRFNFTYSFETEPLEWSLKDSISNVILTGRLYLGYELQINNSDNVFTDFSEVVFTGMKVTSAQALVFSDSVKFYPTYPYLL